MTNVTTNDSSYFKYKSRFFNKLIDDDNGVLKI